MQAHLSPAHVVLILSTVRNIKLDQKLFVLEIQRLLLSCSVTLRVIRVMLCMLLALQLWNKPGFLNRALAI